jgi:hypothetical protein
VRFFSGFSFRWLASVPIISALVGCADKTSKAPTPKQEAGVYPGSFRIKEISSQNEAEGTLKVWLATASRGEMSTQFRIELLLKSPKGDAPFSFTKGALMREAKSEGKPFLAEIARILEAKKVPEKTTPLDRLEFEVAILGTSLSRQPGSDQLAGSFTSNPPGPWITAKVFVAGGEGEFYLNLNPAEGLGEISIKDEEYGDIVVQELAKILLPKGGT